MAATYPLPPRSLALDVGVAGIGDDREKQDVPAHLAAAQLSIILVVITL